MFLLICEKMFLLMQNRKTNEQKNKFHLLLIVRASHNIVLSKLFVQCCLKWRNFVDPLLDSVSICMCCMLIFLFAVHCLEPLLLKLNFAPKFQQRMQIQIAPLNLVWKCNSVSKKHKILDKRDVMWYNNYNFMNILNQNLLGWSASWSLGRVKLLKRRV